MIILVAGIIVFIGIHVVPSTQAKPRLIAHVGQSGYKGIFSLFAATGLGLLVYGKWNANFSHVYLPPTWGVALTKGLMLPAFLLLMAAYVPNNLRRRIRHPMLLAVLLWSSGHLMVRGDLASLLFFGSFQLFAVLDMIAVNRRQEWKVPAKVSLRWDLALVVGTIAVYAAIRTNHMFLYGAHVGW